MKKILMLFLLLVTFTGCGKKVLDENQLKEAIVNQIIFLEDNNLSTFKIDSLESIVEFEVLQRDTKKKEKLDYVDVKLKFYNSKVEVSGVVTITSMLTKDGWKYFKTDIKKGTKLVYTLPDENFFKNSIVGSRIYVSSYEFLPFEIDSSSSIIELKILGRITVNSERDDKTTAQIKFKSSGNEVTGIFELSSFLSLDGWAFSEIKLKKGTNLIYSPMSAENLRSEIPNNSIIIGYNYLKLEEKEIIDLKVIEEFSYPSENKSEIIFNLTYEKNEIVAQGKFRANLSFGEYGWEINSIKKDFNSEITYSVKKKPSDTLVNSLLKRSIGKFEKFEEISSNLNVEKGEYDLTTNIVKKYDKLSKIYRYKIKFKVNYERGIWEVAETKEEEYLGYIDSKYKIIDISRIFSDLEGKEIYLNNSSSYNREPGYSTKANVVTFNKKDISNYKIVNVEPTWYYEGRQFEIEMTTKTNGKGKIRVDYYVFEGEEELKIKHSNTQSKDFDFVQRKITVEDIKKDLVGKSFNAVGWIDWKIEENEIVDLEILEKNQISENELKYVVRVKIVSYETQSTIALAIEYRNGRYGWYLNKVEKNNESKPMEFVIGDFNPTPERVAKDLIKQYFGYQPSRYWTILDNELKKIGLYSNREKINDTKYIIYAQVVLADDEMQISGDLEIIYIKKTTGWKLYDTKRVEDFEVKYLKE